MKPKQGEEGYEEPKKPEDKKPDESPETRLDALEKSVESQGGTMTKILTILEKNETDKAEALKKEEEAEEEKKKAEEDKKPEDEAEKKKDVGTTPVNPDPKGGDVKLPQAPAGETDEDAKPAGDKGDSLVQKEQEEMLNKKIDTKVDERVKDILKSMGIQKSTAPRAQHEGEAPADGEKKAEFAMDLLKRAKEGTLTTADMNRETKVFVKERYDANIRKVINQEVQ